MHGDATGWLADLESRARAVLPAPVLRYVSEGARDEVTLAEATAAWREVRLLPRVLRDVREVRLGGALLGSPTRSPLGVAPMTLQRAAHARGEVAMAEAAAVAGVPMVLSSNAGSTFADVGATGATWWLQLYMTPEREVAARLLDEAVRHGAAAVVLTVDTPVVGTRHAAPDEERVWDVADPAWVGANLPESGREPDPAGRAKAMDLAPADLGWLRERSGVPLVVKGVLRGDDAADAVQAGADGVWVSNHGGRQLDQAQATARCVGRVREAVGDRATVLVDGGVRSGLHAAVGLALGADAVLLGRPLFMALAAEGPDGVRRALGLLHDELEEAMRLAGCPDVAALRGVVDSGATGPR
ncbi:alpha-hydroxy acid oxidase [Nocardioides aurantiacus]|uniref:4-hydroxymandelate oxidase n=1 Tax=Nocardioides aurantiacus TaxID=86796 RepID=A0A3N2CUP4_9ACTN|nr:alpha-hydroxy acid oxidase [Nocardioides aurantiacus]ROR91186.1 4-hydroxymandelate oxidase [Nocardioides aurantiacus]